jgi:hypothetical protein
LPREGARGGEARRGAAPGRDVGGEHAVAVDATPAEAAAAVAAAAEGWGAEWQADDEGGRLALPVLAGLRQGYVAGRLRIEPAPAGASRLVFTPEERELRVQTPAVAILLFAAAGGLLTVLWPFFPRLLAIAPLGAVIALSGWFLVVSRLRTSGPEDFLGHVAKLAGKGGEAEPSG